MPADFQGTTISLTNPGTVGTFGSVPRLMVAKAQLSRPARWITPPSMRARRRKMRAQIGISKVMMVTCTYDHRIIQGAESGRFLGRLHALLNGADNFYETIFTRAGTVLPPGETAGAGSPQRRVPVPAPALPAADPYKEAARCAPDQCVSRARTSDRQHRSARIDASDASGSRSGDARADDVGS